jgi:hypothetical protein
MALAGQREASASQTRLALNLSLAVCTGGVALSAVIHDSTEQGPAQVPDDFLATFPAVSGSGVPLS